MRVTWPRLIRFVATDGRLLRGGPILPDPDFDLSRTTEDAKLQAKVIIGEDPYDISGVTRVSNEIVTVKKLLGPLAPNNLDILRCVGLNYAKHKKPVELHRLFHSFSTCVHDHDEDVIIPQIAQNDQADYEGELVLAIGKDAKDVPLESAMDYIAAYTASNDVSSRKMQRDPNLAGRVPQWGFSKGFNTFAPLGPALIASELIGDPKELLLQTIVDGEVRQKEYISDLLFDCAYLVYYLSQGTTLRKGSVVMTGTPGGVGAGLQPPKYLVPGTVMEISISKIGTLRNGVKFA
ncbi:uncharacterized protein BDZ99DRAFT_512834 [Mytilinidion resinicola]|uniref:Fumarylacetoacetase-like C-terminal domain-containing protein n=1 Tax=Mytilinidion resinicola TaxID=574789 RepID=A0A6A6XYM3_9PEZI|nr:uncharacterized protein BDZ99DRAFT_512834 [Mytilinidion resinicola]KAF2801520.1 hypothetical protein BDZ99DRAFT_512834 [Mytilinidion resinicola]